MAGTEEDPGLLADISQSASRHSLADPAIAELMRLLRDPLLLHEHLNRPSAPPPPAPRTVEGFALAAELQRAEVGAPAPMARHYLRQERRMEPSLVPEAFEVTALDRESAIEYALPQESRSQPLPLGAILALAGALLLSATFLLH